MSAAFRYCLGVGANLGDPEATFVEAVHLIQADELVRVLAVAPTALTEAQSSERQPPYRNGAWLVESGLGAHQLLQILQRLERALGRVRTRVNGPRTLDLDLLLRDDGLVVDTPVLTLPHPRLHLRAFVLEPLRQIAGSWRHPLLGMTITQLHERLRGSAPAGAAG